MTNPMHVMKPKTAQLDKLEYPLIAQLKYDGVRLITLIINGQVTFWTYNGKQVPLLYVGNKFKDSSLDNIMIDGEITVYGGLMKERTSVSGMINSAMHGGKINEHILQYNIFDAMSLVDYNRNKCDIAYTYRYQLALEIVQRIGRPLTIARNTVVYSAEEVNTLVEQIYADGLEGLILKSAIHMYSFKRDKAWARIKQIKTVDLYCTDVIEGKGWCEGMVGALYCEGRIDNKFIQVKIGSGFTKEDRTKSFDCYIHNTIEVKYNSIVQDSRTGQHSLFLPRYVCVRFDK